MPDSTPSARPEVGGTSTPPQSAVGRYALREHVGGGVYRAYDPALGRDVLLTLAHPDSADADRFTAAARAAAGLRHPNLVPVSDVGRDGDRPFAVAALPDGTRLDLALAASGDGRLPPRRAAEVARGLAAALAHAHGRGIALGPVQATDVWLGPDGEPLLAGLGAARPGPPASQAGDQHAVGALLYHLLTGAPPPAASPAAAPPGPRAVNRAVPRDLDAVCRRCLDPDPIGRYASCADLAEDLGRWLAGRPVAARPAGRVRRLARWARRRPGVVAVLVALAALGVLAARFWPQASTGREEARRVREMAAYGRGVDRALAHWTEGDTPAAREALAALPVGDRGWEWDYVERLCQRRSRLLPVPGDPRAGVGEAKVTVGWLGGGWAVVGRGAARTVYHLRTGAPEGPEADWRPPWGHPPVGPPTAGGGRVPAHGDQRPIPVGPGGCRVIKPLRWHSRLALCDPATGAELAELPQTGRPLVQSPDGLLIAGVVDTRQGHAGPYTPAVNVWEVLTGRRVAALPVAGDGGELEFSPDGRWLAAAGWRSVEVWPLAPTAEAHVWPIPKWGGHPTPHSGADSLRAVAVSPDGRSVATGEPDRVVVRDAATGVVSHTLGGAGSRITAVAFAADGRAFATQSDPFGPVVVRDARTGRQLSSHGLMPVLSDRDYTARRRPLAFGDDLRRAVGGFPCRDPFLLDVAAGTATDLTRDARVTALRELGFLGEPGVGNRRSIRP
ncbi:MAG TPA: hypothetical protein VD866_28295 [Urbifossiella sp.]|nr:hypothetical protein [Urbifossiella sp.]